MAATAAYTLSLAPTPLPSSSSSSSNSKRPISSSLSFLLPQIPNTSFLSIQPVISLPPKQTHRSQSTSILFMLPTAKPDRAPANKIQKWSARSIKSFGMAELEARKLKYPTTGTEALLMGILVEAENQQASAQGGGGDCSQAPEFATLAPGDPGFASIGTSEAAKFQRANGITLFQVREETVKLLGKSDMYFFSPEHPPLTEPAQRALDWAVDEKMKSGEGGEVTTSHMLLGIWSEKDSAGHKILATLGFDDKKASELAKGANKDVVMSYK